MAGYFSTAERRGHPANLSGKALEAWLIHGGAGGGSTGVDVNQESALSSTAMLQGLRILSASVGMVPLGIFQRLDPGRELMRSHPAHMTLQDPNPEITAIELRQMVTSFAASAGNGYAEIVFDGAGRPRELWPIPPHRIAPDRAPNGTLRYRLAVGGEGPRFLPMERVLHLRGFMRGGLLGIDTVQKLQEAVGLAIATEKFAGSFFGNGSHLSGWLKFPGRMGKEAKDRVRQSLDAKHTGLEKAHRIGFLEEGMEWVASGVPPEQSQLIEQRRFSVEEVARALNVPPHLLHHLERATFNNIEELGIGFVVYSLGEWYVRWEQVIAKRMLLPSERPSLYAKHNPTALLRGNHEARGKFYQLLHQLGALSPDDIREFEDMNPLPGGVGNRYFVRRDTWPLDQVDELVAAQGSDPPPTRSLPAGRSASLALRTDFEGLFREAAESTVRKEVVGIRAALRKAYGGRDTARLRTLVDELYADHGEWVTERFLPTFRAYGGRVAAELAREGAPPPVEGLVRDYAAAFGRRWVAASVGRIRQIIHDTDPDQIEAVVEACLAEWEAERAGVESAREIAGAGEAIAAAVLTT